MMSLRDIKAAGRDHSKAEFEAFVSERSQSQLAALEQPPAAGVARIGHVEHDWAQSF